jgi:hypothetical protein
VEGDPYTDAQLERGSQVYGQELISDSHRGEPGSRLSGQWVFDLGIDPPSTRLERVLALAERGELTEDEREQITADAAHARNRVRNHVITSPAEAAERMESSLEAAEQEAVAIAESLER